MAMSEDKPKPVDDLKEGLGLLFRAAKGAVQSVPTDKLGDKAGAVAEKVGHVATDAVKEVNRAFESLGAEIQGVIAGKRQSEAPPAAAAPPAPTAEAPKDERKFDDGYAPEPPKGPRVG